MDNFRRPKPKKRGSTLDGFLNSTKNSSVGNLGNFRRPQNITGTRRKLGGDFAQSDGFVTKTRSTVPGSSKAISANLSGAVTPTEEKTTIPGARDLGKKNKKEKKPRSKWRTLAKRTVISLVVVMMLGGGYVGAKAFLNSRKVLQGGGEAAALEADVDPSRLNVEGDGRINILLLGRGGAGHEGPDLTDTMLIASIDPIHKEAALVSIPRDLWVKSAKTGGFSKINAVYANAKSAASNNEDAEKVGQEAVEKTVEQVFGIPIHYHGMIDFEGFRQAIDTVGGIDVNVQEQLYDPSVAWENGWNPLIAAVGQQHFDGKKALLYVRSRHGSAGGDFSRGQRQREVIIALKDKVLSAGTYSNPVKVTQLLDAFGGHIQTNFGQKELMALYSIVKDIPGDKVASVGLTDPPHDYFTTDMISGQSVVVPKAGIGNYAELQNYIRNTLKDAYIRDENANIAVLNGTDVAGLATDKANMLKSYGYNVGTVGDSPVKNNSKTVIVDMRDGQKKYTKHYLQKRFGVTATTKLPDGIDAGTADFVIIVTQ